MGREIASVALVSEHASPVAALGGPDAGGQNVYVAALAQELGRRGIDVTIYTRRDSIDLPRRLPLASNVVLEHVDAGPPRPLSKDLLLPFMGAFGRELSRAWWVHRPDVVHAHYWMSGLASMPATRSLRLPLVQTFHALGVTKRRHQGHHDSSPSERAQAEVCLASRVDAVAATSTEELAELRGCGARSIRAEVVPCGVDTTLFRPVPTTAERRRVVAVGRLVKRKGFEDLVRCMRHLPTAELLIAGGEGGSNDEATARLRALSCRLGIANRVTLLGPLEHAAMPDLLRSATVVACIPWYEPFGMVALEAMACAIPVVVTDVGGLRDTVVQGETGIRVRPRDPVAVVEALATLLGNPALRARLGQRGAMRARSHYSWGEVTERLLNLYSEVAGR